MEGKNIDWKKGLSGGTVFKVPPGYFESLPGRVMVRIHHEESLRDKNRKIRLFYPWMAWVASAAAVLVVGLFALRVWMFQPDHDRIGRDRIESFMEYYGMDFNEEHLAGFAEESGYEIGTTEMDDYFELIEDDPGKTEAFIYESVIY
jgi:hypothetical protein